MKKVILGKKSLISLIVVMMLCFIMGLFTTITAFAEVTPKTVDEVNFTMANSPLIRVVEDNSSNGLKFRATMSKNDYDALLAYGYDSLTFGIVIAPADYTVDGKDFTEENLFGEKAIYGWANYDTETGKWGKYEGDKTEIINIYRNDLIIDIDDDIAYLDAAITNIHYNNIARDFVARGYIMANDGADYAMANYAETKEYSMALVAEKVIAKAKDEGNEDDLDIDWITANYIENSQIYTDLTSEVVQLNNYAEDGNIVPVADLGTINCITDGDGNTFSFNQDDSRITIDLDGLGADKEFDATIHAFDGTYYKVYKIAINFDKKTLISDEEGFLAIRNALSGDYILMNDIDLTNDLVDPKQSFGGSLDGNGHTISGVNLQENNFGIFSTIGSNAVVKNLFIKDAVISSGIQTGVIAAFLDAGAIIENVYIKASIGGNNSGGIAKTVNGGDAQTKVTNCVVNITNTSLKTTNGLLFGFGSAKANVDLTGTYAISSTANAKLVGDRGDSYATFRDNTNALNATENKMVYNSATDFNDARYAKKLTVQNEILCFKALGFITISSVDEFKAMRTATDSKGKYYILTTDLTLTAAALPAPASTFGGVFDGNGHSITGMTLNSTSKGMFKQITGSVKNLALVDVNITAQASAVGDELYGGVIDNVYVSAANINAEGSTCFVRAVSSSTFGTITNCVAYIKEIKENVTKYTRTYTDGTIITTCKIAGMIYTGTHYATIENLRVITDCEDVQASSFSSNKTYTAADENADALKVKEMLLSYAPIKVANAGSITVKDSALLSKII